MKTVLFAKDGKIFENEDYSADVKEKRVQSIKNKLGCYVKFEDGLLFKHVFNSILNDKDFFDQVFSQELDGYSLKGFEKEWKKKVDLSYQEDFNIKYLEVSNIYDHYRVNGVKEIEAFSLISAVGTIDDQDIKYSITLVPISSLKKMKIVIDDNVKVYDIDSEDEEESFTEILSAKAKITIYEMIRAIIFEIAMYGGPEEKKEKIKEFLEGINAKTMISSLKKSLEEAIENEDYEGAAEFKRIINQLSKK